MYNPRWPHTLRVLSESLDSDGMPVVDSEGMPVRASRPLERVEYGPDWNPRRRPDGTFVTDWVEDMPWGYRTATGGLKTSGEVIVADYKVSCPMILTEIETGAVLELTDYTHTFRVKLLKMTTYNWGTNLWLDNIKN